jgi:integrase
MVTTSDGEIGNAIHLQNTASKGRTGGRVIPLNKELRAALLNLRRSLSRDRPSPFVVTNERSPSTSPQAIVNLFSRWYAELGFKGCSSHSGRRTFVTNAALNWLADNALSLANWSASARRVAALDLAYLELNRNASLGRYENTLGQQLNGDTLRAFHNSGVGSKSE